MSKEPWLTFIGMGEDGADGLSPASLNAIKTAKKIYGAKRLIDLLENPDDKRIRVWPIPFADGIPELLQHRGEACVMLVSGDPFWYGAGRTITRHIERHEWHSIVGVSVFSRAASELGWPLEETTCLGLHAAPLSRLRSHLSTKERLLVTLRDGAHVKDAMLFLLENGFGDSRCTILEALGGASQRIRKCRASAYDLEDVMHPVILGIEAEGEGALPFISGLADDAFEHDGQITKRRIRAITLSTLAPKAGELLWDIGSGSGSIAIEWLRAHPRCKAIAIEQHSTRLERITRNAERLGMDRLQTIEGRAPECLSNLAHPNAVFIGGGLSEELLQTVSKLCEQGVRLVVNSVTLETDALVSKWHKSLGGDLWRIELAQAQPLGQKTGWKTAYPVLQWSVTL